MRHRPFGRHQLTKNPAPFYGAESSVADPKPSWQLAKRLDASAALSPRRLRLGPGACYVGRMDKFVGIVALLAIYFLVGRRLSAAI